MKIELGIRRRDEEILVKRVYLSEEEELKKSVSKRYWRKMKHVVVIEGYLQMLGEEGMIVESESALKRGGYEFGDIRVGQMMDLYVVGERFGVERGIINVMNKSKVGDFVGEGREFEEISLRIKRDGELEIYVNDGEWLRVKNVELDDNRVFDNVEYDSLVEYFGEYDYYEGVMIRDIYAILEMEGEEPKLTILSGVENKKLVEKRVESKELKKIRELMIKLGEGEREILKGELDGE